MRDKSIFGDNNIEESIEYINECVREVCINGADLSDYEKMIGKMFPDKDDFYMKVSAFIEEFKKLSSKSSISATSVANLNYLAREIYVTDDTVKDITRFAEQKMQKHKEPVPKKGCSKKLFGIIIALIVIALFALLGVNGCSSDINNHKNDDIKINSNVHDTVISIVHDTVISEIHDKAVVEEKDNSGSVSNMTSQSVIDGHEFVDLGLPSGLKWATCNVGASIPEKAGNCYAYGEMKPKVEFNDENYSGSNKWGAIPSWNGSWKVPSEKNFKELLNKCSWRKANRNGINGYEGKGPNGNTIFFPLSGGGTNTNLKSSYGYYWTSEKPETVDDDGLGGLAPFATYMSFGPDFYGDPDDNLPHLSAMEYYYGAFLRLVTK